MKIPREAVERQKAMTKALITKAVACNGNVGPLLRLIVNVGVGKANRMLISVLAKVQVALTQTTR